MMNPDHTLTELLVRWQEAIDEGQELSPTELCPDDPERRAALVRAIADMRGMSRLLERIDAAPRAAGPAELHATMPPTEDTCTLPTPGRTPIAPTALPLVPRYAMLEELGRGGMGIVYRARDLALARIVAVKMLLHGAGATPYQRARFRAEAQAIARLHHPNIVHVYHADEWRSGDAENPLPFFAMEYVLSKTLGRVTEGKPQAPADVARLGVVLARAVDAAHKAGVVHRDLKPGNVLLAPACDVPDLNTRWGCPKISDFGLARLNDPAETAPPGTGSGMLLGTPAYMAPEQAEGRTADIGPATDLWALGVILYELLAGCRPFHATTTMLTLQKICSAEPAPLPVLRPDVPPALARIVERCLRKHPAQRYASAADLAADLQKAVTPDPVSTVTLVSQRRHTGPGVRMVIGVAVAAVFAVAAGTVVWMIARPPHVEKTAPDPAPPAVTQLPAFRGWIDVLVSDPYHRRPLPELASSTLGLLGAPLGDGSLRAASAYYPGLSNPNARRRGLRLHEPGARPLRPGDEVHIEVGVDPARPGYVYIVWIDAVGRPIPIYPWEDLDWRKRPVVETPITGTLVLPNNPGEIFPIDSTSPRGVETLLLLVRDTPLQTDRDVPALLGDLGSQVASDSDYVRWFQNYALVTTEPNRAPTGRKETSDPAERTQGRLKERLHGDFAFSRAVSFFNLGPR